MRVEVRRNMRSIKKIKAKVNELEQRDRDMARCHELMLKARREKNHKDGRFYCACYNALSRLQEKELRELNVAL